MMTYIRKFGSYSNACKLLDLPININIFGNSVQAYTSINGDICYSSSELIITNYLYANGINYKKEVLYKDIINDERCKSKRCDWLISDNIIVEFFGMPRKKFYEIRMNEKRVICKDNNIRLIELFEKDLRKLDKIFNNIN